MPDLAESRKRERYRWARWLYDLYPAQAGGQLGSVQPDLLAETHVTTRLASNEELARDCLHQLPERPASHAMDVLARACAHQEAARTLITTALRTEVQALREVTGKLAAAGPHHQAATAAADVHAIALAVTNPGSPTRALGDLAETLATA